MIKQYRMERSDMFLVTIKGVVRGNKNPNFKILKINFKRLSTPHRKFAPTEIPFTQLMILSVLW